MIEHPLISINFVYYRGDVLCRKCDEAVAEVVIRVKDAYCR